jgi:hypothetical protein
MRQLVEKPPASHPVPRVISGSTPLGSRGEVRPIGRLREKDLGGLAVDGGPG